MEVLLKDAKTRVEAIYEPGEENAQEALKIVKNPVLKKSSEEIYGNNNIDGVVIASPSAMHASQSIEALRSGKAVFCQKPLGRTAAEVEEVVTASLMSDKLLGVDLSYRYTKAFQEIYSLIKSGEIGEIYSVDLVFHNAYGPDKEWFYDIKRSGGGCVMDLGIHLIDMAMWSLDFPEISDIKSNLYYKGKKLTSFEEQVEDYASVSMTTEKDATINLQCSWHVSAGRDAVIETKFFGTKGGAAFKNVNGSFYDFTAEKYTGTKTETLANPPDDWSGRAGVHWANQVMEGKGYDDATAREFIKTAKIIDQIYRR